MENLDELIKQEKFIRVDAQGEHVEEFEHYFTDNNRNEQLKKFNRYPADLIALYNRTQNKKFLNDIGLALMYDYVVNRYYELLDLYNNTIDDYKKEVDKEHKENNELSERITFLESEVDVLNEKIKQDKVNYTALDQIVTDNQSKLNNLTTENIQLAKENANLKNEIEERALHLQEVERKTNEQLKTIVDENTNLKEELEKRTNNLRALENTTNEEVKELTNARNNLINENNQLKEYTNKVSEELNSLKEKNQTLDKLYKECENEKLAYENDYNRLLEDYKELDANKIDKDKYCIYEKEKVNNLIDNIINTLNVE